MLNARVPATAECMPVSMMAHVIAYEAMHDALAERVDDQDAEDPAICAQFAADYQAMTDAFQALLVARPSTVGDQQLRVMCLLRRIAEDGISGEDMATFLRSLL